ncbi:DMT family transporter [Asticcacaulis sp. ZE23SCel15]|uniref:DMT family transporter n=1 Tax=Asticcacaulis sp. ZE23SCel15 TaxID=3059027 RepID=UPI00265F3754|nr:DMT family transporter [Asticcacaulis sp. ZE23SCel15]WKL57032.1 DMT family transporter [Asticcacaulis sp. ZE23SCel15]
MQQPNSSKPETPCNALLSGGTAQARSLPALWGSITGIAAMMMVIAVWTGFSLSARGLSHLNLTPADAALVRFGLPALLFLPLLKSRWPHIRRAPLSAVLSVFAGGGLPFYLVAVKGATLTSAALSAALIPGGSVLIVSLFQALNARSKVSVPVMTGLTLIACGLLAVTMVSGLSADTTALSPLGTALVFVAGALWALFTLSVRKTGLDAIGVSLVQCLPSLAALAVLSVSGYAPIHLGLHNILSAWPFILAHGVGTGLMAGLCYAFAIRKLGAVQASALGSLSPAVTAICAGLFLGEPLTPLLLTGAALVSTGVILLNLKASKPRVNPIAKGVKSPAATPQNF